MISNFTDMMEQVATYWAPLGNDGYGGVAYDAPLLVACRYQMKTQLVRSQEGQEVVSSSTVYVDRPLKPKGYLILGDQLLSSDPRTVEGSEQIISIGASPSLDADEVLNVVYL